MPIGCGENLMPVGLAGWRGAAATPTRTIAREACHSD
jgi:hypothetical protein